MKKYIDADELKKVFCNTEDAEYVQWTLVGVIGEIDDIEAADVVEVVRCSECKFHTDVHCYQKMQYGLSVMESDYCSKGKRKDG